MTNLDKKLANTIRAAVAVMLHSLEGALSGDAPMPDNDLAAKLLNKLVRDFTEEDLANILEMTAKIRASAKSSCMSCYGKGILRRAEGYDACDCVYRKFARGEAPSTTGIPGRQPPDEARIAMAAQELAAAHQAVTDACAKLDAEIHTVDVGLAAYRAERERISTEIVQARESAKTCDENSDKAERLACSALEGADLELDRAVQHGLRMAVVPDLESVKGEYDMLAIALPRVWESLARGFMLQFAQHNRRIDELTAQIAVLDADNAVAVKHLEHLRVQRDKVAARHMPKVERCERKLRRLKYVSMPLTASAQP